MSGEMHIAREIKVWETFPKEGTTKLKSRVFFLIDWYPLGFFSYCKSFVPSVVACGGEGDPRLTNLASSPRHLFPYPQGVVPVKSYHRTCGTFHPSLLPVNTKQKHSDLNHSKQEGRGCALKPRDLHSLKVIWL